MPLNPMIGLTKRRDDPSPGDLPGLAEGSLCEKTNVPIQWFSKWGPWTSSISGTQKLVRDALTAGGQYSGLSSGQGPCCRRRWLDPEILQGLERPGAGLLRTAVQVAHCTRTPARWGGEAEAEEQPTCEEGGCHVPLHTFTRVVSSELVPRGDTLS